MRCWRCMCIKQFTNYLFSQNKILTLVSLFALLNSKYCFNAAAMNLESIYLFIFLLCHHTYTFITTTAIANYSGPNSYTETIYKVY